jgi:hypothetical protein
MRRLVLLVAVAVLAAAGLPAEADAAKRCTARDIPDPRIVDEPLPPELPAALEILRRPQGPEERIDNAENAFGGDAGKVSPGTMRLLARTPDVAFYVYGASFGFDRLAKRCRARLSRAAKRREERAWRRQLAAPLRLAYVVQSTSRAFFSTGAGFFGTLADVRAGKAVTESEEESGRSVIAGLVPDAVATVEASFQPGCSDGPVVDRTMSVSGNGWIAEFPERTAHPFRTVWRAADGTVVKEFPGAPRRGSRCID